MKKIGIVYDAPSIEALLPTQTETEIDTQGTLIGLAFSPVTNNSLEIINLEVHQIYFRKQKIINNSLEGLRPKFYGIKVTQGLTPSIRELDQSNTADEFMSQPDLINDADRGLEYSDQLLQEDTIALKVNNNTISPDDLLDFGFSYFEKEDLLSHIATGTHIIVSGAIYEPGLSGVKMTTSTTKFFNLKVQVIRTAVGEIANPYKYSKLTSINTTRHGYPCPPGWQA